MDENTPAVIIQEGEQEPNLEEKIPSTDSASSVPQNKVSMEPASQFLTALTTGAAPKLPTEPAEQAGDEELEEAEVASVFSEEEEEVNEKDEEEYVDEEASEESISTVMETESEEDAPFTSSKKSSKDKKPNANAFVNPSSTTSEQIDDAAIEEAPESLGSEVPAEATKSVPKKRGRRAKKLAPVPSKKTLAPKYNVPTMKIPPLSSPGLLLNSNGIVTTPSIIFNKMLEGIGYTNDYRKKFPHKISSIGRSVDDMFDFDIIFESEITKQINLEEAFITKDFQEECPNLINQLGAYCAETYQDQLPTEEQNSFMKRMEFEDMLPTSLTSKYPSSYEDNLQTYMKNVLRREEIVMSNKAVKEANQAITKAKKETKEKKKKHEDDTKQAADDAPLPLVPKQKQKLQTLPAIPKPPKIENFEEADKSYKYVAHLDPSCFLPTHRYHSLFSNGIADPHFVGPNAPMLSQGLHPVIGATIPLTTTSISSTTIKNLPTLHDKKKLKAQSSSKIQTTATLGQLKKIMESSNTSLILNMRMAIIKTSMEVAQLEENTKIISAPPGTPMNLNSMIQHPFVGCDGEIYPDVVKAFATYGGLKPCKRCKSNKQGAFHCRMRRKHDDKDYDGGDSTSFLEEVKISVVRNDIKSDT